MGPLKVYFIFKVLVTCVVAYIFSILAFLYWTSFY